MKSKNYFKQSEFYKKGTLVPGHVRNKISRIITFLNPVREQLGSAISVSQQSGYRPLASELRKGRSGDSEHVFRKEGAVDLTAKNLLALFRLLIKTDFKRICIYPRKKFIHCDFKGTEKAVFFSVSNKWIKLPRILWP